MIQLPRKLLLVMLELLSADTVFLNTEDGLQRRMLIIETIRQIEQSNGIADNALLDEFMQTIKL